MVTSSKILTVAYGTFSCTLEGFDDPFTTLQMVAEYFRKLAAEDRYFGGIPQTPDTETLKQIARNATSHDVDADVGDNGITLRQSNAPAPEQDPIEAVAESVPESAPELVADPLAAPLDISTAAIAAPASAPTMFHSRRHTPAPAPAPAVAPPPQPEQQPEMPKNVEATLAAIRLNVEQAEMHDSQTEDTASLTHEVAAISDDSTLASTTDEFTAAPDTGGPAIAPDTENPVIAPDTGNPVTDAQSPLILTAQDTAEDIAENTAENTAENITDQTEIVVDTPVKAADAPHFKPQTAPQAASEQIAPPRPEATAPEAFDAFADIGDDIDHQIDDVDDIALFAKPDEDAPETDTQVVESTSPTSPTSPTPPANTAPPTNPAPIENSILSPEQEAELARDLEQAMLGDDDEAATPAVDDAATERREQRRLRAQALRNIGDDGIAREEQALERLLVTTQSKMDKPEQLRRINALDQLKAAVAATEAEQKIKQLNPAANQEPDEEADDLAAYRDDLRRAQNRSSLSGRTGAAGLRAAAAPLILVSEQRINDPAQTRNPAQPDPAREVAQSDGNLALKPDVNIQIAPEAEAAQRPTEIRGIPADAFAEATTFADFAERIGAVDMVELLEAAAAYTSIVEGQPKFSRAQAMSKIAKIAPDDMFSKEAGLRAFGKLLREGKILRVQDGQFAISKASRFSVAARFED